MISQRQLFLNHIAQTTQEPLALEVASAQGIYLTDIYGKKYIDLISGIGVSALGHSHPAVISAIKKQADLYLHTMVYGEHIQSPQVKLAKLLTDNLPDDLSSVYFVNSGAEAIEGAMKLAKKVTGRYQFVSCKDAYHGSTHGAASLMDDTSFTDPFRPLLPGMNQIVFNNEEDLQHITSDIAGVVIETVQGEAGIITPQNDFLKKVKRKCDQVGALLILDEVQAGYGRTGQFMAFEHYDVIPDILVLAKGMGGGMPIGAFVSSLTNMTLLNSDPILGHITTYGGHPMSAAAGYATLKTLIEEDLPQKAIKKGEIFRTRLENHPAIREVRSKGLMMAIQLDSYDTVSKTMQYCYDMGLIIDWFLFNDSSMRIAPPLIITEEEIHLACDILIKALDKATAK